MNLSYPYLIADPRGSIVDSTGPAAELLGTDSEAIVGSQIEDLAATEDQADLEHLVTDPGWQPRTWRVGTFHAVRDGHPIRLRFAAIGLDPGRLAIRLDPDCDESGARNRDVAKVLEAWRQQERDLAQLAPGTIEYALSELEADWLSREYQRLVTAGAAGEAAQWARSR